ncbi:DNA topoisomerase [Moraxella macacae 0408225]|uniref:DNA topoisomerase n=1 Tax=Moraxella macacae 0408225 TaxID=1230338 RepID=L2F864_9GAMM|nr:DNA topoisomerase 3 [Moraxella macacae]ELA09264.1 DNA topoisomerase [Moraxella macacae 0408225]
MRLFIAEKPDLARAIAKALGGGFTQKDGYLVKDSDTITWCFGHMLALKQPEEIDERYKYWRMDNLPILATLPAPKTIPKDKAKQVAVIKDLLKQADTIVHAGDPDEEGQLLVDELLSFFNNTKPVLRILINDNTPAVVQKALANLKPNREFEHLGQIAQSRAIADQLFGFNFTRAYSLAEQAKTGEHETLHIGRVQTPILGLIVRRDRQNASHQKSLYYLVQGEFSFANLTFKANYQTKDTDPVDDPSDTKARLIDKDFAHNLANLVTNKPAKLTCCQTTHKSEAAPLPYNLLKLQQDASRLFGYKPDDVMSITQSLREKHQLITYNRSDCQYLSDEQFADVANVLNAINQTLPNAANVCTKANLHQKGRAFNSAKVSAHHAIIPTQTVANWQNLSQKEQNLYKIIARSYLAQFYPPYEFDETKLGIEVMVDGKTYHFSTTARAETAIGWKWLYQNDSDNPETQMDSQSESIDLRSLTENLDGLCNKSVANEHETKPPPLYSMTSLLGDLTRVAKYVKNPELATSLKDKDKEKQGEHGGIGTPATRSNIINNLFERGYLVEKGKTIVSTAKGQALYDLLDDTIRFPDMTAIWHDEQKNIKTAQDVAVFITKLQNDTIIPAITALKASYTPKAKASHRCPKCSRPMYKRTGKYGTFWGCSGYNDTDNPCSHVMDDKDGKPVEKPPKAPKALTEFDCKACGAKLTRYDSTSKQGKPYTKFNCSNFPKCKQSYWGKDGKPDYG